MEQASDFEIAAGVQILSKPLPRLCKRRTHFPLTPFVPFASIHFLAFISNKLIQGGEMGVFFDSFCDI